MSLGGADRGCGECERMSEVADLSTSQNDSIGTTALSDNLRLDGVKDRDSKADNPTDRKYNGTLLVEIMTCRVAPPENFQDLEYCYLQSTTILREPPGPFTIDYWPGLVFINPDQCLQ